MNDIFLIYQVINFLLRICLAAALEWQLEFNPVEILELEAATTACNYFASSCI